MRLSGTQARSISSSRGLGNQLWDLAGNRPSLDLRFADDKSLVDATTGTTLVDHTRASSGTYVGSDGLIKTATTNLLLQSEDFSTTWANVNINVNNAATVSPVGTPNGNKLVSDSSSFGYVLQDAPSLPLTGSYTYSFYAKSGEWSWVLLWVYNGVSSSTYSFDLGNGVSIDGDITPVGNGWYRCSKTVTLLGGTVSGRVRIYPNNQQGAGVTTGDGTSGIYLWGAQLEQSSTVGEYIPTTSTINSAPRFDHDPTTGESLGLLVEESRTNLVTYSEDASQDLSNNGVTVNLEQGTAPDGTNTANKVSDVNNTSDFLAKTGLAANTYTFSFWIKAVGSNTGTWGINYFDGSHHRSTVPVTTSWVRHSISFTSGATTNVYLADNRGDLASLTEALIWGVQIEEGSFPTSYIPTEGTTVTRAADVADISGSNFSSWMTSFGENTFFVEARNPRTDNGIFVEGGASTVQGITIGANNDANRVRVLVRHGPSRIDTGNSNGALFGDDNIKIAATTSADGSFVYVGGALQAQDGTPSQSDWSQLQLNIGSRYNGSLRPCCTISRITYWSQKLSEPTLQGITQ